MSVDLGDSYLIWCELELLLVEFDVLKTSYSIQKSKWTINELIFIITQAQEDMRKENVRIVNVVFHESFFGYQKDRKERSHHGRKKGNMKEIISSLRKLNSREIVGFAKSIAQEGRLFQIKEMD